MTNGIGNLPTATTAPHVPIPRDLPALPGSPLAKLRADIDAWDHIPTARTAAGSYTRATLAAAIRQAEQDEPRPYDSVVLGYGQVQANAAFGSAA